MNWWISILQFSGIGLAVGIIYFSIFKLRKAGKYAPFSENSLRPPGHTLAIELDDKAGTFLIDFILVILIPIFAFLIIASNVNAFSIIVTSALMTLVVVKMFKVFKSFNEFQPLRLGYQGEVYTGQELNYLMRKGAYVYHDLPYQYGNIDHLVVSTGGIFAVETKTFRKYTKANGERDSEIRVENGSLKFSGYSTSQPIKQALRHKDYLSKEIERRLGISPPVQAVVALPGWYIKGNNQQDCLIINPKRGKFLEGLVARDLIAKSNVDKIAQLIEDYCRSVDQNSNMTDPDASKKYTWNFNRRHEENKL